MEEVTLSLGEAKGYYKGDKFILHCETGPALVNKMYTSSINDIYTITEEYFFHGIQHRSNGPAVIKYYSGKVPYKEEYFLFGTEVLPSQYFDEEWRHAYIMEHS